MGFFKFNISETINNETKENFKKLIEAGKQKLIFKNAEYGLTRENKLEKITLTFHKASEEELEYKPLIETLTFSENVEHYKNGIHKNAIKIALLSRFLYNEDVIEENDDLPTLVDKLNEKKDNIVYAYIYHYQDLYDKDGVLQCYQEDGENPLQKKGYPIILERASIAKFCSEKANDWIPSLKGLPTNKLELYNRYVEAKNNVKTSQNNTQEIFSPDELPF